MDLLFKAEEAVKKDLCDHCLGRLFALLGHGLTNKERGKALRVYLAMASSTADDKIEVTREPEECAVCHNLFDELDKFASLIAQEFEPYDYDTFLVGTRIDPEIIENEEKLWTELDITTSAPIKSELNREIGKRVYDKVDAEVDLEVPDIKGIIDTRFDTVEVEISPLFVYGRYMKLSREIPQTQWNCKDCWGRGCMKCGFTGKMYETSVEEIIGEPLLDMALGDDFTLHGMGREDIDAKMLGDGRPFIMEIKNPVKREVDFDGLKEEISKDGRVEVGKLRLTNRDKVKEIKAAAADKSYRAEIRIEGDIERGKFKKGIDSLKGTEISQRTPSRVSHRRSDKVRKRKVYDISLESFEDNRAVITLTCQAGTYVKELIHGDQGRTQPNLAEELGTECTVDELDVLEVHYKYEDVVQ
ncbi:MAG: tRNA pseudouridine(54/55) synthase Pus10 [Thermoplasmata archaeon]